MAMGYKNRQFLDESQKPRTIKFVAIRYIIHIFLPTKTPSYQLHHEAFSYIRRPCGSRCSYSHCCTWTWSVPARTLRLRCFAIPVTV
jgi:hypothetical protein